MTKAKRNARRAARRQQASTSTSNAAAATAAAASTTTTMITSPIFTFTPPPPPPPPVPLPRLEATPHQRSDASFPASRSESRRVAGPLPPRLADFTFGSRPSGTHLRFGPTPLFVPNPHWDVFGNELGNAAAGVLQDKNNELHREIERLNKQKTDLQAANKDYHERLTTTEGEFDTQKRECDAYKIEIATLKDRNNNLEFDVKSTQNTLTISERNVVHLKQQLETAKAAEKKGAQSLADSRRDLQEARGQFGQASLELKRTNARLQESDQGCTTLKGDLKELEQDLKRIEDQLEVVSEERNQLIEMRNILNEFFPIDSDLSPSGMRDIITDWVQEHSQVPGGLTRKKKKRITSLDDELSEDDFESQADAESIAGGTSIFPADEIAAAALTTSAVVTVADIQPTHIVASVAHLDTSAITIVAEVEPACIDANLNTSVITTVADIEPSHMIESEAGPVSPIIVSVTTSSLPWWSFVRHATLPALLITLLCIYLCEYLSEHRIWLAANEVTRQRVVATREGGSLFTRVLHSLPSPFEMPSATRLAYKIEQYMDFDRGLSG